MQGLGDEGWFRIVSVVYFIAVTIAAIATGISIAAGIAQYKIGNRISDKKDREFSEYKAQEEVKVANANERASTANKQAAEASKRVAEANEKIALLNNQTEQLSAENLHLKLQLSWREIDGKQQRELIDVLRKFPGTRVSMQYSMNDAESENYVSQFSKIFKDAGWVVVDSYQVVFRERPPFGIVVAISSSDIANSKMRGPADALLDYLYREKLSLSWRGEKSDKIPPGEVRVIVGVKRPLNRKE
ncbi:MULTISPECIES: hypothetical protein [unclassified Burkholderia]|uniref:hypothetical protein n=1 Tax=unclassified Burkholderia TaxID=2613784 RepID=UPI000F5738F9|nr:MULTISPECIES: hypothetical protein [unclassified Burkholderia]